MFGLSLIVFSSLTLASTTSVAATKAKAASPEHGSCLITLAAAGFAANLSAERLGHDGHTPLGYKRQALQPNYFELHNLRALLELAKSDDTNVGVLDNYLHKTKAEIITGKKSPLYLSEFFGPHLIQIFKNRPSFVFQWEKLKENFGDWMTVTSETAFTEWRTVTSTPYGKLWITLNSQGSISAELLHSRAGIGKRVNALFQSIKDTHSMMPQVFRDSLVHMSMKTSPDAETSPGVTSLIVLNAFSPFERRENSMLDTFVHLRKVLNEYPQ